MKPRLRTLAPAADDGLLMTIIQSNLVLKHQVGPRWIGVRLFKTIEGGTKTLNSTNPDEKLQIRGL